MKTQFFRLYAFAVISLIAVLSASAELYRNYYAEQTQSLSFEVPQFADLAKHKGERIKQVPISELSLPPSALQQLEQESMISVALAQQQYLYIHDQEQPIVYQIGPLQTLEDNAFEGNFFLLVYSLIALLMLVLTWPLFKDLNRLKKATRTFARDRKSFVVPVSKGSSIYPLAQSMSDMSEQIARFIQLHEDLSRIISHEIRTPLSRMRFTLSLADSLDEQTYASISRNIDAVEKHLDQYLSFARIEHQALPLAQVCTPSDTFFGALTEECSEYSNITFSLKLAQQHLYCEPESFAILVQNLLGNGCKYANQEVVIEFYTQQHNQYLVVYDDGEGLPADADALLKPFAQGKQASLATGYGLGLYIVQCICHWHGGTLSLSNQSQTKGACITICWPIPHN